MITAQNKTHQTIYKSITPLTLTCSYRKRYHFNTWLLVLKYVLHSFNKYFGLKNIIGTAHQFTHTWSYGVTESEETLKFASYMMFKIYAKATYYTSELNKN